MKRYVTAVQDGEDWVLTLEDLDGTKVVIAGCRTLKRARQKMSERLEEMGAGPYFTIRFGDPEMQAAVDAHADARKKAQKAVMDADAALSWAALALHQKMSLRDVAVMLGYSHQYIAHMTGKKD